MTSWVSTWPLQAFANTWCELHHAQESQHAAAESIINSCNAIESRLLQISKELEELCSGGGNHPDVPLELMEAILAEDNALDAAQLYEQEYIDRTVKRIH